MSAVWNQQANDVFLEALEQPAAKREAFARRACGENPALWGQVRALLAASDEAGSFLETPATGAAACPVESLAPPGAQIGPYKLLQQIGEGGMGVVYMAEQHEPIERRVALKIIKPGMDTRQVIARFEAERQALALMNHPNIAKVFDAGTTGEGDRGQQTILSPVSCHLSPSAGRPYFVMELVRGIPITKYCDDNRLTPRQRLELFVPVCHAIQHAHQKGIIHRDIKPTNVLVAEYDNQPVPQIIDFGVAKATGPKLTEQTMFTGFGQLVGTLEYMSPEQAKFNQLDIDTRSDIYSLGVLLYELLTGSTPLEQSRLRTAAFDETLRVIREEEPLKPSTKLGISDTLPAIAANRGVKPAELRRQVRGDLDWIVIKTLDKERSRRYQTASELALDIQRFLQDKPVEACVPSVLYRLRKYARRHRMAVLTAGLIVLFLLLVIGGGAWMGRQQARRQSRINQEVAAAVREATLHGNQALSLVDAPEQWEATLTMAFSALKRAEALGEGDPQLLDPALRDKVHQLAARLEADERDRRLVETIERIRLEKSEPSFPFQNFPGLDAIPKYRHALASCGLEVGTTPVDQAASWIARKHPSVRNELIAGLDDWRELESGNREQTWLSAVVAAADADPWRNQTRQARQRGDRAALEALAEQREILSQPPATVVALASALRECGARDSAAHLLRQAQRRHPDDFWINHTLASILERVIHPPRPSEAVMYYRIAIALRPRNGGVYFDLGTALVQSGDRSAAMGAYQKAIELQPQYAQPRYRMAEHLNAISAFQKATELDPVDGESHTDLGSLLQASRLKADRQLAEAAETLRQAAADNPQLPEVHCALGKALYHQGRFPEALAALERGHELGSQRVNWRYPTAQWILEIRRRVELADKVSAILAGTQRPVDAEEGIELAQHCTRKRLHLGAARFYEWSFSVDPDSAKRRYRLLAACAAAMAGCHRGNDASQLGEEESARWRKQAVAWLRVDLDAWAGKLGDKSQPFRESVKVTLQYIQGHPDLAGLREEEFLEQLPEPERAGYRQLWMDVETIFAEATNDRR